MEMAGLKHLQVQRRQQQAAGVWEVGLANPHQHTNAHGSVTPHLFSYGHRNQNFRRQMLVPMSLIHNTDSRLTMPADCIIMSLSFIFEFCPCLVLWGTTCGSTKQGLKGSTPTKQ